MLSTLSFPGRHSAPEHFSHLTEMVLPCYDISIHSPLEGHWIYTLYLKGKARFRVTPRGRFFRARVIHILGL